MSFPFFTFWPILRPVRFGVDGGFVMSCLPAVRASQCCSDAAAAATRRHRPSCPSEVPRAGRDRLRACARRGPTAADGLQNGAAAPAPDRRGRTDAGIGGPSGEIPGQKLRLHRIHFRIRKPDAIHLAAVIFGKARDAPRPASSPCPTCRSGESLSPDHLPVR